MLGDTLEGHDRSRSEEYFEAADLNVIYLKGVKLEAVYLEGVKVEAINLEAVD
jgi:hypothetical protein